MTDQGSRRPEADDALPVDVPAQPVGRVQTAVEKAIVAAQLDDRDAGAGALAVACGRAVDLALGRRDPYAVASVARELRETLTRLKLDPVAREGNDAGNVEAWLAGLDAGTDDQAPR